MNVATLKTLLRRLADAALHQPTTALALSAEVDRLRASPRFLDRKCLIPFGHKIYSQTDEDGIIREIFSRIGVTNRTFVEFGVGDGLENNTLALLFDGWQGLWIEGSASLTRRIRANLPSVIRERRLSVTTALVTRDNIDALISAAVPSGEIDLMSVDIDGNDYHVFESVTCVRPRVIVMEYNARFPPPLEYCMAYDAAHVWREDDCFGASLKFLELALARRGYCLVGCSLSGVNAFFVRQDLAHGHFLTPFTAEQHYEPARYYLGGLPSGHPASYRTLERSARNILG